MTSLKATSNRFNRHPKTTLAVVLLLIFLSLDLTLGYFFCPKVVGTPDAYYHHDLPKNFQGVKPWGQREYPVFTNSLGFIDRERRQVPLQSDNHRILLLGDSFVEGVGLEYDQTFAGLLATQLAPYQTEILNAGVTSYSPKLYYLKTKYLLEYVGLKFDDLFVFIDISDIIDEIFHTEFRQKDDEFLFKYYFINKIDSYFKQRSIIYYSARIFYKKINTEIYLPDSIEKKLIDELYQSDWLKQVDLWTIDEKIYQAWGKDGLILAGYNIEKLKALCDDHNITMHLAVYPWPTQIKYGDLNSIQVSYWQELCAQLHIDFINYFPAFINVPGKSPQDIYTTYFIQDDVHWNAAGHRLVADRIYEQWLLSRKGAPMTK